MGVRIRDGRTGHTKQLPWREDPEVLDAIDRVVEMHSKGISLPRCSQTLGIPIASTYRYWNCALELRKERVTEAVNDHIAELYALLQIHYNELEAADRRSQNKGVILGAIRQTIMDIAKLDGSLVDRKEVKGDLTLLDLLAQAGETPPEAP